MQQAVVLDHRVRGVEPGPMDLVDLLLGKPCLLGKAVVVLLHPAVDEPLSPQVAQDVVRRRWPLVIFDRTLLRLNIKPLFGWKFQVFSKIPNILQNTRYLAVLYIKKQLASCQMFSILV